MSWSVDVLWDRGSSLGEALLKLVDCDGGRWIPKVQHGAGWVDAILRCTAVGVPVVAGTGEVLEGGRTVRESEWLGHLDYALLTTQLTLCERKEDECKGWVYAWMLMADWLAGQWADRSGLIYSAMLCFLTKYQHETCLVFKTLTKTLRPEVPLALRTVAIWRTLTFRLCKRTTCVAIEKHQIKLQASNFKWWLTSKEQCAFIRSALRRIHYQFGWPVLSFKVLTLVSHNCSTKC